MKYSVIFLLVLFMVSCGNKETEQSVRDQISAYKKEVNALNQKIADLEKELENMNSTDHNSETVPVEVMVLSYEPFNHYIQVSGTAEAVKEAYISPEVSGQIREIYVNEGEYVEKGDLLVKLNTEVTESSIADMQSALELATIVFEKQQRLWDKGIGSELQYLNAKNEKESLELKIQTLRAQLDMALIKSPVSGIVDKIYNKKGELALPGVQLMQIVNLEELYINADVSEKYLGQVKEGETVKVEFPVFPDMSMEVPIHRKGNIINPNNRTFTVQLKLKNPNNLLKPNILSILHINDFSADSAIVIPASLIKQDITGSYIYTMQPKGEKWVARKVYVTAGKTYQDKTMVINGLQAGQKIIVRGYNMVSDGSEVYVQNENAS